MYIPDGAKVSVPLVDVNVSKGAEGIEVNAEGDVTPGLSAGVDMF